MRYKTRCGASVEAAEWAGDFLAMEKFLGGMRGMNVGEFGELHYIPGPEKHHVICAGDFLVRVGGEHISVPKAVFKALFRDALEDDPGCRENVQRGEANRCDGCPCGDPVCARR